MEVNILGHDVLLVGKFEDTYLEDLFEYVAEVLEEKSPPKESKVFVDLAGDEANIYVLSPESEIGNYVRPDLFTGN